ncbi:MAG: hypothetical protein IJW13_01490 [Clostridia bacterium]|nr:hypothetical protein [Clostridia bacterium]
MKDCGLIRIDEVGRIVIPKEMRRVLKLDGSRLVELYVERDKLVIKRYAPLLLNKNYLVKLANKIAGLTGHICIMGTCERVVAVSGQALGEMVGKNLTAEFSRVIREQAPTLINSSDGGKLYEIVKSCTFEYHSLALTSVVEECAEIGFIALISTERDKTLNDGHLCMLKFASELLVACMERCN